MSRFHCRRRPLQVVAVLLAIFIKAISGQTLRRKINDFTISISPVTDFTASQTSSVRNTVEAKLQDVLEGDPSPFSSNHIHVDYVLLAAAVETSLDGDTLSLTLTGLVYFTDDTIAGLLPDEDSMSLLVGFALNPSALANLIEPIFPSAQTIGLNLNLPTESPSAAPTVEESSEEDAASGEDTSINGIESGNQDFADGSSSSDGNLGVIIGAVAGGLVLSLLVVGLLVAMRRRQSSQSSRHLDGGNDVWKVDTHNVDTSPAKTERMEDFDEEEVHPPLPPLGSQKTSLPQLQQPPLNQPRHNPYHHQNANGNENMMMIPKTFVAMQMQMRDDDEDDDVSSSLDFNLDDLASDYDEQTVTLRPHLIPVEPVESFEHHRQFNHMVVKKDMLSGVASNNNANDWQQQQQSGMFGPTEDNYSCALEPTDVSAATLAIETRPDSPDDSNNKNNSSSLMPRFSWWGGNNDSNNTKTAAKERNLVLNIHHPDNASSDGTSFGGGGDWDPDDLSSMGDNENANAFSSVSVENKDEQSLLQHSLRNESYKMQRLRTPPPETLSRDNRSSRSGPTPPSSLGMGRHKQPGKILTLSRSQDSRRHNGSSGSSSSSSSEEDLAILPL